MVAWRGVFLAIAAGIDSGASCGKRGEEVAGGYACSGKARAYPLAKLLQALLLRQKNEAIAQAEYGKRSARPKAEILAELLGDGKLAFFADLGGGEVFEGCVVGGHRW